MMTVFMSLASTAICEPDTWVSVAAASSLIASRR